MRGGPIADDGLALVQPGLVAGILYLRSELSLLRYERNVASRLSRATGRGWLANAMRLRRSSVTVRGVAADMRYEPDVPPSRARVRVRASIVRHVLSRHGLIAY